MFKPFRWLRVSYVIVRPPEKPRERQSFHPSALLSLDTDALSSSANAAHPAYGTNRNAAQRSIDHSAAMKCYYCQQQQNQNAESQANLLKTEKRG